MDNESRWRVSPGSMVEGAEPPEVTAPLRNPWLSMWLSPRRTVRSLMASEQRPSWIPVVALAAINTSLLWMVNGSGDTLEEPGSAVAFAFFRGGLQLVYGVLVSPFLVALIGGWFGAEGDAEDVRLGIAWAYVPVAVTLILWLPLIVALGWEAFRLNNEQPTPRQMLALLLYMPLGLSPFYAAVLQVGGIAAALRTSLAKAFMIMLVPAIPVALLTAMF